MSGRPRVLWAKEVLASDGGLEYDFALALSHPFDEALLLLGRDPNPVYTIAGSLGEVVAIFTSAGEPLEESIAEAVSLLAGYGVRVCAEVE